MLPRRPRRLKIRSPGDPEMDEYFKNSEDYAELPTEEQRETAKQIFLWNETNRMDGGARRSEDAWGKRAFSDGRHRVP